LIKKEHNSWEKCLLYEYWTDKEIELVIGK